MKYVVLLGDGMADWPVPELDGKTPLEAARTPNMDRLASLGACGAAHTIPDDYPPGSDVANLAIMGYDPAKYYSGRAPLEAASMGVELGPEDVAYRCNLVTLKHTKDGKRAFMDDYSAGHITTEEAKELIRAVGEELDTDEIKFYPGISYRHLMVWSGGQDSCECAPPHDILGREITDYQPVGPCERLLRELMLRSVEILSRHKVNTRRTSEGKNPANSIWLWGQGKKPALMSFREKYGIEGSLVSAVDLTRGLAVCAGLTVIDVPGATGYLDTNYAGKVSYSLEALKERDFLYLHVEAPDEAGHSGDYKLKVQAIEDFDKKIVGPMLDGLKTLGPHKVLLMPDHPTPLELRTHTNDPVPFVIYTSGQETDVSPKTYDENLVGSENSVTVKEGHKLMDLFIKGTM